MKSSIIFLLHLFAVSLRGADGFCSGGTMYASTTLKTFSRLYYQNREYCTFYIRPSIFYSSTSYYLEIRWISFNVEGNMPTCKDYAEVYLTRSYKSIGRYCSDNMVERVPFTMYSYDSYAKIVFKSDSSITRSGFVVAYQLKSKSGSRMGIYPSTMCHNSGSSSAAIYYSAGWPSGYLTSSTPCWKKHYAGNYSLRIAVMDLSLYRTSSFYCYPTDSHFEVKASSMSYSSNTSIHSYGTSVSGRICGTKSPTFYTAKKSYVYFYYHRPRSFSGFRGIMIGYMAYSEKSSSPPSATASFSVIISATVGSAVAILVWLK